MYIRKPSVEHKVSGKCLKHAYVRVPRTASRMAISHAQPNVAQRWTWYADDHDTDGPQLPELQILWRNQINIITPHDTTSDMFASHNNNKKRRKCACVMAHLHTYSFRLIFVSNIVERNALAVVVVGDSIIIIRIQDASNYVMYTIIHMCSTVEPNLNFLRPSQSDAHDPEVASLCGCEKTRVKEREGARAWHVLPLHIHKCQMHARRQRVCTACIAGGAYRHCVQMELERTRCSQSAKAPPAAAQRTEK